MLHFTLYCFCGSLRLCNAWYESEGYYLFPEELREELEGIAEVLIDVGLSPNKLVLLNLGYDYLVGIYLENTGYFCDNDGRPGARLRWSKAAPMARQCTCATWIGKWSN